MIIKIEDYFFNEIIELNVKKLHNNKYEENIFHREGIDIKETDEYKIKQMEADKELRELDTAVKKDTGNNSDITETGGKKKKGKKRSKKRKKRTVSQVRKTESNQSFMDSDREWTGRPEDDPRDK